MTKFPKWTVTGLRGGGMAQCSPLKDALGPIGGNAGCRREVRQESGQEGEGYEGIEGQEMRMHKKPQNTTHLAFGTPFGGYRPMTYIFRKLFSGTTFHHR